MAQPTAGCFTNYHNTEYNRIKALTRTLSATQITLPNASSSRWGIPLRHCNGLVAQVLKSEDVHLAGTRQSGSEKYPLLTEILNFSQVEDEE